MSRPTMAAAPPTSILILALSSLLLLAPTAESSDVGICYGRVGDNLPPPATAVQLLKANGITRVRLFNPEPATLASFKDTGVELTIGVPNEDLPALASGSPASAAQWLQANIFAHVPAAQVRYLAVGNEVLYKDTFYTPFLLPSLRNLHAALESLGLADKIKLSTAHASSVLASSYPPSSGSFDPSTLSVMRPLLGFLSDTGAPLMVNIYPYFSYINNLGYVQLSYALFGPDAPVVQDSGAAYSNLFDATVDAFVAAVEREGFPAVRVVVTETGWPTAGGEAASPGNAAAYNRNVVGKVLRGAGTPRRPDVPVEVFLFGVYDENGKPGQEFEKHFGIFQLNGSKAYDISFV